jgi:large subunit ribosomal protein L24
VQFKNTDALYSEEIMSYIKKNDLVIIRAGKDKGKTGKVLKVLDKENKAIVEGVNLVKKHQRKRKQEEPAGILTVEVPINLSKVSLYCPKCKKGVKVKINRIQDKKKERICKKCQSKL